MKRLQQLFLDHIILLGRDYERLPMFPDLTPLDFFVWGYNKSKAFLTPPANLADLRQRITMEVAQIPLDIVIRAIHKMRRSAKLCILNDGGHIEERFGLRAD